MYNRPCFIHRYDHAPGKHDTSNIIGTVSLRRLFLSLNYSNLHLITKFVILRVGIKPTPTYINSRKILHFIGAGFHARPFYLSIIYICLRRSFIPAYSTAAESRRSEQSLSKTKQLQSPRRIPFQNAYCRNPAKSAPLCIMNNLCSEIRIFWK